MEEASLLRVRKAVDACQSGDARAARRLLADLVAEVEAGGGASAFLLWTLAWAQDASGDPFRALRTVRRALAVDPFDLRCHDVKEELGQQLRAFVLAWKPDSKGHSPEEIYGALVDAGEASIGCHLAVAEADLRAGRPDFARSLLEALVGLYPGERRAWELLAQVGEAMGDCIVTVEAKRAAMLLESMPAGPRRRIADT